MATKFYLLDGATTDTGTLPSGFAAADDASLTSSVNVSGADTNRTASTTISGTAGQRSGVLTTLANVNAQPSLLRRFVSDPIAAQTIGVQTLGYGCATSESSTNSDFLAQFRVSLWRPGTGALVGFLTFGTTSPEATTSEVWISGNIAAATTSRTALDGDIIVIEAWRPVTVQLMATAYTNTFFYDGTTEGSATTPASFINFPNTLTFYTPPAEVIPDLTMAPLSHG
jgi:hypothetical protein